MDNQTDSLISKLYNSRHAIWRDGQHVGSEYRGPVVDVVRDLAAICEARGWTLSRWQTNGGRHTTGITWAVHTGPRPARSDQLGDAEIVSCILTATEGSTTRCEAYRALANMRDRLQQL